jgi:predicted small integral membrane protein
VTTVAALRLSRIALAASVAALFTLVAFGNVTDYGSNFAFVQHVLAMDTTFGSPGVMWRAITMSAAHHAAYAMIIAWEAATAALLWAGVARLWRARAGAASAWNAARGPAILGLTAGALLHGLGFLVIAGEWFAMWQSRQWNGQASAAIFLTFTGLALLHLSAAEPE